MKTTKVLFVCLGNICRSPTAQGVFTHIAKEKGVVVEVDSCGTGAWHVGEAPDARATKEAKKRGLDISNLRARQITQSDFQNFDYVLCMDRNNLAEVRSIASCNVRAKSGLFLEYASSQSRQEVPDPYFEDNFEYVFDLIIQASEGLIDDIKNSA